MKRLIIFILLVLTIIVFGSACTLAGTASATEANSETIIYNTSKKVVQEAVVQIIITASPLGSSNGWTITQNDDNSGFIRAETSVTPRFLGFITTAGSFTHAVTIIISPLSDTQSQIVIQSTSEAGSLAQQIVTTLDSQFGRAS
jgi:hypothetical protein